MKKIILIILLTLLAGSIGLVIWNNKLTNADTEPNQNVIQTDNEVKYHLFDDIEEFIQHPKAKGHVLTWEEFLDIENTTLQDKNFYIMFTHHNYHKQVGYTAEQYIIDYYYPNDMEGLNTENDFLPEIYFIDLGDERNYDLLWDEENGISRDYTDGAIDLHTLKLANYPVMMGKFSLDGGNSEEYSYAMVGHNRILSFYLKQMVQEKVEIRLKYKDDLDSEWASGNNPFNFKYEDYFSDIDWRMQYKDNFNK
ncbi:hypothetical protein KHQ81_15555 (plasmid) [Mycoplasmatota bacterium]|nr:hypothetical protein KHQ81_15555 [Mycoplasmatota bacterium]